MQRVIKFHFVLLSVASCQLIFTLYIYIFLTDLVYFLLLVIIVLRWRTESGWDEAGKRSGVGMVSGMRWDGVGPSC